MDIGYLLLQYAITFGWAVTGAVSMGIALAIVVGIFSLISPVEEWKLVEKGNLGMALILSSIILGSSLVIALTLMS